MKQETQRLYASFMPGILFIFVIYLCKIIEIGMDTDLVHLGIYPMQLKGILGIITHPFVHADFNHLFANTFPLVFLVWCTFYFYKDIAFPILLSIWIGCGLFTFIIGKPAWHIGASGIIYGLAFFLFFSGLLRKHIPLIAISLLITFLYGGIVWQMLPQYTPSGTSWEGHLSGAIIGTICSLAFLKYGPQKPPIEMEDDEEDILDDEVYNLTLQSTKEDEKRQTDMVSNFENSNHTPTNEEN